MASSCGQGDLAGLVEVLGRGVEVECQGGLFEGLFAVSSQLGVGRQGGFGERSRERHMGLAQGFEAGCEMVGFLDLLTNRDH